MAYNDDDEINSTILKMQNIADIKALLDSGLTSEQVLNLMLFRASFILLLAEILNSDNSTIDLALTPLLDKIIIDHNPYEDFYKIPSSDQENIHKAHEIYVQLNQTPLKPEIHNPALAIADRVSLLYDTNIQILPAKSLAKEILVQLSDAHRGTGVWQHT